MSVEFEPVKKHIGAIVHVPRDQLLTKETAQACFDKLEERTVLVFPQANLTDEEQLKFTDLFGDRLNFTNKVPGSNATADDVYKVTLDTRYNPQPEYVLGTFFWHMDGITVDTPPPKATLLSARVISKEGGQTEFASTTAAYEGLPNEEKAQIDDLRCLHDTMRALSAVTDDMTEEQKSHLVRGVIKEHPVVWKRKNGTRSMVLGSHADRIVGMQLAYGRALIARLIEWCGQPTYSYRHYWKEGDFVIWDNCGAMHRVIPYPAKSGRTMHRTAIAGVETVG